MTHVIIRGEDGRRHEVDFGEAEITVSLHAGAETIVRPRVAPPSA